MRHQIDRTVAGGKSTREEEAIRAESTHAARVTDRCGEFGSGKFRHGCLEDWQLYADEMIVYITELPDGGNDVEKIEIFGNFNGWDAAKGLCRTDSV